MQKISAGKFHDLAPRNTADHSGLMLAARITLAHLLVASAMSFAKSADVNSVGSRPKPTRRAFILGPVTTALISLLSFSIISAEVPLGAPTPYHVLAS